MAGSSHRRGQCFADDPGQRGHYIFTSDHAVQDRAEGCWHFAGEEPYDAARRAEINRALSELNCTTLKSDGQALRRKYARSAPALAALDAAAALE